MGMIDPKKKLDRFLMFLPGFLTWVTLLMPIWLGFIAPKAASFAITFFSIYWIYMGLVFAYGLLRGYKKYEKEIKVDWYKKCKELDFKKLPNSNELPSDLSKVKHFILIPTYTESYQLLDETFRAIMNSSFPVKNLLIVIGMEERGGDVIPNNLKRLKEKYKDKLPQIKTYVHPAGIPGEIVGVASPNRNFAARHAVQELIDDGENLNDYIFTTFDSDARLHKEFLARLTYAYLTEPKRKNRFFETVMHIFTNNIWDAPIISRIESYTLTLGVIANWQLSYGQKETFSCYSSALTTLVDADFWDVGLIDDTVFFWRAYIARSGDFEAHIFFIPVYSDATTGKTYLNAHVNLYKQLVRWGFGSVATVIALKAFITNWKKFPLETKLLWLYSRFERHIIFRTTVFINTFGFPIVTLTNEQFRNNSTVYSLPQIISVFFTILTLMFIPTTYLRIKLYGVPKKAPAWRKVITYLEGPMIFINLFTFSTIPWLVAETRMMLGELPKVTFYTPKKR